ncbi:MAG: cell wall hydrolase [Sphingomonadaceae bacterium]
MPRVIAFVSAVAGLAASTAAQAQNVVVQPALAVDRAEDRERALTCLATAIAYEAAFEPQAGQQAVAEVILNRLRHPAYPKTVCGVVYAGAQRRTGCQFSFTCDGSLKRTMSAGVMAAVRTVATAALDGQAASQVSGATHYHADYVSPYWAPSLVRVAKIGAHIFYRMPGTRDQGSALPRYLAPDGATTAAQSGATGPIAPAAPPKPTVFAPWGLLPTVHPQGQ